MARILKIALLVLFVWAGVEIYSNGLDRAFGGLLAQQKKPSVADRTTFAATPQRAGESVRRAYEKSEARVDKLLEEKGL